jgi:hypothetical protein
MKNSVCHSWYLKYLKYFLLLNLLIGFMLTGCVPVNSTIDKIQTPKPKTSPDIPSKPITKSAETPAVITSAPPKKQVTITGWFTTIWNGEPHYSITDDQGQTTQLLLDDEIAKPLGGPLELDRKRVTIIGEIVSDSPRIVRVLSVQFVDPG